MLKIKKNIHKKTLISIILFFGFSFYFLHIHTTYSQKIGNIYTLDTIDLITPVYSADNVSQKSDYFDKKNLKLGGGLIKNFLLAPVFAIFRLIGYLIYLSIQILLWTFDPSLWGFIKSPGVYVGWSVVRDFLNLFFIFFLLYSAFCTIFQISRYHIRSTWVMIIVMALLVNFSWPITRILIDLSNVSMVYLLGDGGTDKIEGSGIISVFSKESNFVVLMLGGALKSNSGIFEIPDNCVGCSGHWYNPLDATKNAWNYFLGSSNEIVVDDDSYFAILFFGIIVGFIFLVTFLSIAVLLIIRIVILTILLIFSPVGFAFAAFPATRGYASQWWGELNKQLIAGPILLFNLLLATIVLQNAKIPIPDSMKQDHTVQTLLAFLITIVLLWVGIITSQKVGAAGSDMAFNLGKKALKFGKKVAIGGGVMGATFVGRRADVFGGKVISGLGGSGRAPSSYVRNIGQRWKNMSEAEKKRYDGYVEESKAAGLSNASGMGGDRNASRRLHSKKVLEEEKKIKEDGVSHEEAMDIARDNNASAAKRQAALNHAMKSDKFGEGAAATGMHADFVGLIDSLNHLNATEKAALRDQMEKKYVENGNALHIMQDRRTRGQYTSDQQAYDEMFRGMSGKVLGAQDSLMDFINQAGTTNNFLLTQLRGRFSNNVQLQNQFLQNSSANAVHDARTAGLV